MKKRDEVTEIFILFIVGVVFLLGGISSLVYYAQNAEIATEKNWFGSVTMLLAGLIFMAFCICYVVTEKKEK